MANHIVKSEMVRVEFSGIDYLNLSDLTARMSFTRVMNQREEKAAVVRLGITLLKKILLEIAVAGGAYFVEADADALLNEYMSKRMSVEAAPVAELMEDMVARIDAVESDF